MTRSVEMWACSASRACAGPATRGKRILAPIDQTTVTHLDTGEVLSHHTIDPTRSYWPNTQKEPGRWPSSS